MTKFVAVLAFATLLGALAPAGPAAAATRHHHVDRTFAAPHSGPGYYEGLYQYHVDENDRASSPYAGGGY